MVVRQYMDEACCRYNTRSLAVVRQIGILIRNLAFVWLVTIERTRHPSEIHVVYMIQEGAIICSPAKFNHKLDIVHRPKLAHVIVAFCVHLFTVDGSI